MVKDFEAATLDDFEKYFDDVDLVITEGYKTGNKPKIEIFRSAAHKNPCCLNDDTLIAVVTDTTFSVGVPSFGLDDIEKLVDLIEEKFLRMHLSTLGAN